MDLGSQTCSRQIAIVLDTEGIIGCNSSKKIGTKATFLYSTSCSDLKQDVHTRTLPSSMIDNQIGLQGAPKCPIKWNEHQVKGNQYKASKLRVARAYRYGSSFGKQD